MSSRRGSAGGKRRSNDTVRAKSTVAAKTRKDPATRKTGTPAKTGPRKAPAAKASPRKAPAAKASPRKAPAAKASPRKTPAAKVSPRKTPAAKASLRKAPAAKASPRKAPAAKASPRKAPAAKASPRKAPTAKASPRKAPAAKASPRKAPAAKASPHKAPAAKASPRKAPAAKASPRKAPAAKASPRKAPDTKSSQSKSRAAQSLARSRLLRYIHLQGKAKTARRLDTTIKDLEKWVADRKIPRQLLPEAIGLGTRGTGYAYLPNTLFSALVKKLGVNKASRLTGLPPARISEILSKRKNARIKIAREKLAEIIAEHGPAETSKIFTGANPRTLISQAKVPPGALAKRLHEFSEGRAEKHFANYLGISPVRLQLWIKNGVPASFENEVKEKVGRFHEPPSPKYLQQLNKIEAGRLRNLRENISAAIAQSEAWNAKAPHRFHISKKTAQTLGKLGTFAQHFIAVKNSFKESKKPLGEKVPAPPPVSPQTPPPAPPLFTTKKQSLPAPALPSAPPITNDEKKAYEKFKRLRDSAISQAKIHVSPEKPDLTVFQDLVEKRKGLSDKITKIGRHFTPVNEFVRFLNLSALGNQIITKLGKTWKKIYKNGLSITVILYFTALGHGNPFYPEAWISDDQINEFKRKDVVVEDVDIQKTVRSMLADTYEVDQSNPAMLLHMEAYEFLSHQPTPPKIYSGKRVPPADDSEEDYDE